MGLLTKLLEGEWPETDFLVLRPGQKVISTNDEQVIGAESLPPKGPPAT